MKFIKQRRLHGNINEVPVAVVTFMTCCLLRHNMKTEHTHTLSHI